jgi:hypothetical protein
MDERTKLFLALESLVKHLMEEQVFNKIYSDITVDTLVDAAEMLVREFYWQSSRIPGAK